MRSWQQPAWQSNVGENEFIENSPPFNSGVSIDKVRLGHVGLEVNEGSGLLRQFKQVFLHEVIQ